MRTDWPSPHNGRVNTGIQRTSSINDAEGEKGVLHSSSTSTNPSRLSRCSQIKITNIVRILLSNYPTSYARDDQEPTEWR